MNAVQLAVKCLMALALGTMYPWSATVSAQALPPTPTRSTGYPAGCPTPPDQLLLKDFHPVSIYKIPRTHLEKARFPVIDVHSHAYAHTRAEVEQWVRNMDQVGIEKSIVMANAAGKTFDDVLALFGKHADRFEVWCGLDLEGSDRPGFADKVLAELIRCRKAGARGVGELIDKGRGLNLGTSDDVAAGLHIDDPHLDAVLEKCAELRLPVNVHVGEDRWNYEPMDQSNDGLMSAYAWRVAKTPGVLGHDEVIATLDRAAKKHPHTTFIACHFANCCSDLSVLGRMLDAHPNLYADTGGRFGETAAIPRYMKKFFEKYQDRILYGTDLGFNLDMYRETFRVLETEDEHFYSRRLCDHHWPLHGIGLGDKVLKKLYADNARRILSLDPPHDTSRFILKQGK